MTPGNDRRPGQGHGAGGVGWGAGTRVDDTSDASSDAEVLEFVAGLRRRREAADRLEPLPFAPFARDPWGAA